MDGLKRTPKGDLAKNKSRSGAPPFGFPNATFKKGVNHFQKLPWCLCSFFFHFFTSSVFLPQGLEARKLEVTKDPQGTPNPREP